MSKVEQLKALGFQDAPTEAPARLILRLFGHQKQGKSHFALTGPPPIIYFDLDTGTEGVVEKFSVGKEVIIYKVRRPKEGSKTTYASLWGMVKERLEPALQLGEGTVILDTATEAFELARLAHFGKLTQVMPHHYTEVNSEWREIVRWCYESTMNAVFIDKMKREYVNNQATGNWVVSGFSEMGYLVQANVEMSRKDNENGQPPLFTAQVRDCRQNANISGMALPGCTLGMLLGLVHGS